MVRQRCGDEEGQGWRQRASQRTQGLALGLFTAAVVQGCSLSAPQPGPSSPRSFCGDGVCSASETVVACPADCAPPARCGDGVCALGETCASCPADCEAACVAPCQAVDLRTLLPVAVRDTTATASASTDEASCGDGAVGPLRRYRLDDVPPGRYRLSAQASFDLVIDARRLMCGGEELACEAAYSGNVATFLLTSTSAQTIVIEVAGLAGGAGDFSLDITPEPQCGDSLCQDETCSSCPADCGVCPPPAVCGDGTCAASGETCASCPGDCGACPPAPRCGDGSCQTGESCGSCPADCGSCGPSCGDGMCDFGEDCVSCPFDCGACAPGCGDGRCDISEDCVSCSFDCGTCSDPGPTTDPFPPPDPVPPADPFPDPGSDPWWLNVPGARAVAGSAGAGAAREATARR